MTSNAADIKYGVEIETHLPTSDDTPIGGYHRGLPVSWLPSGWKVERDASIRTPLGRRQAEFVSPVMRGEHGLDQIEAACDAIKARGGKVNESCGIHVTVSFDGDAAALARLVNLVANHEKALYAMTGTTRREDSRRWCKGHKGYGDATHAQQSMRRDRYHLLNLTHIAAGRKRVEFRVFSGSLNDHKITAWVQICLALVELAMKQTRKTSWDYKKKAGKRGPWDNARDAGGATEITRLYYRLGWTKGHSSHCYGNLRTATLKRDKEVLKTLGRKYDAQRNS